MKFSCDKAVLSAAVSNVSRAVTTRTALQALEGILIRAEGDTLTLTGYDLELGITTVIPAAVSEEGSIILGARLFGEMIRKLEGGEVFVASDDKLLTEIRGGGAEFTILGMDAADYPELPGLGDAESLTLPQHALKSMIEQTQFAISQNDTKPVHTGSLFDVMPDSVTVVSVDGYRMAVRPGTVRHRPGNPLCGAGQDPGGDRQAPFGRARRRGRAGKDCLHSGIPAVYPHHHRQLQPGIPSAGTANSWTIRLPFPRAIPLR